MQTSKNKFHQQLEQLSSQCVMCGLCAPHCPTYQLQHNENASPRGRIALIRALARQQIDIDKSLQESLQSCLQCRACEKVCPSQVHYAQLFSLAQQQYLSPRHNLFTWLLHRYILVQQSRWKTIHRLLKGYQYIINIKYIAPLFLSFPVIKKTTALLPSPITSLTWKNVYPANVKQKKNILLFNSCAHTLLDQAVIEHSILLLNALGYNVFMSDKQACCGLFSKHQGDTKNMARCNQKNQHLYQQLSVQYVISINSACSAHLHESDIDSTIAHFDIIDFILLQLKNTPLQFRPLAQPVLVHIPCSSKNILQHDAALLQLLHYIPQIQLISFNNQYCCGAAGTYMLKHPDTAQQLLTKKIYDIEKYPQSYLISNNIACTLHIATALKNVRILHPVSLLTQQLTLTTA